MTERQLQEQAADALRAAGFLVQFDVPIGREAKTSKLRADILAWAADDHGARLAAVVEVKSGQLGEPDDRIKNQLIALRSLAGAPNAYIFDGEWWSPEDYSAGFSRTSVPRAELAQPADSSDAMLEAALARELWGAMSDARSAGVPSQSMLLEKTQELLDRDDSLAAQLMRASTSAPLLAKAIAIAVDRLGFPESHSGADLNRCLAALARFEGGQVFDPFCGIGETLLFTASSTSAPQQVMGAEVNETTAQLASILMATAKMPFDIRLNDSIHHPLDEVGDLVISQPPFGLRLSEPMALSTGIVTRDGDLAAIDAAIRAIRGDGRAVLAVAPGVLFRESAMPYRRSLAAQMRLVAVFQLPVGTLPGTSIAPAILVVEKKAPGRTLFADVGDDWEVQLQPGGELYQAYVTHLGQA